MDKFIGFHQKREISFTWQVSADEFSIDMSSIEALFGTNQPIAGFEQFLSFFSSQDKDLLVEMFEEVKNDKDPAPVKANIVTSSSSISLCLISAKKLTDSYIAGVIVPLFTSPTHEDLSSFFHQLFENNHHGMVITDERTRIVACNSYFENSTGYKVDELIGKKTSMFNAGKHDKAFFTKMWKHVDEHGYWAGLILSKSKSKAIKPQELLIQKLVSIRGNTYYLGVTLDLSDNLYRVHGIEHGGVELLTQLPNEDEFVAQVHKKISSLKAEENALVLSFAAKFDDHSEIEQKYQLASALISYDNGCASGLIKKTVFSISIFYERDKSKPHSLCIFEALKAKFNDIKTRVSPELYRRIMDCTIGVSVLGLDANNERKMISHSLQAMYEKHTTSNSNICFFNRNLHEKARRRETLEQVVKAAIEKKSLEVFFQPIISTTEWNVAKLEALCRFRGDDGEYFNTQEMIQIAEDMDLAPQVDLIAADKAIRARDQLTKLYGPDIEVTINISLNSDKPMKTLFSDIMAVLQKHDKHLPYITVELTESAYFNSEHQDSNLLFELRKKGLKVAIDDFGTGYSSFSYLKDGNFDILKIDREFIQNLSIGSHNYYIVKMITQLAHTLDVKVVAEGVESLQEVNILADLKVEYLQGFYFAKPLPINLHSADINNHNKFKELSGIKVENSELICSPPTITPTYTLKEIKSLFSKKEISVLPVLIDRECVGIITRERYNLHATPNMGTDRESAQEHRALTKVASAMMEPTITRVHKTINPGEIHEKIKNNNPLPWVVINDSGAYKGIIDSNSMLHFLNMQS